MKVCVVNNSNMLFDRQSDKTGIVFKFACTKCIRQYSCSQTKDYCSVIKEINDSMSDKIIGEHLFFHDKKNFFYINPENNKDFENINNTFRKINLKFKREFFEVQNSR